MRTSSKLDDGAKEVEERARETTPKANFMIERSG